MPPAEMTPWPEPPVRDEASEDADVDVDPAPDSAPDVEIDGGRDGSRDSLVAPVPPAVPDRPVPPGEPLAT